MTASVAFGCGGGQSTGGPSVAPTTAGTPVVATASLQPAAFASYSSNELLGFER
jgi:uncharacterized spore protein YtfJ